MDNLNIYNNVDHNRFYIKRDLEYHNFIKLSIYNVQKDASKTTKQIIVNYLMFDACIWKIPIFREKN